MGFTKVAAAVAADRLFSDVAATAVYAVRPDCVQLPNDSPQLRGPGQRAHAVPAQALFCIQVSGQAPITMTV